MRLSPGIPRKTMSGLLKRYFHCSRCPNSQEKATKMIPAKPRKSGACHPVQPGYASASVRTTKMFKAKNTMEFSMRALPLTSDVWVVGFMNGRGKRGPGRDVPMGENLLKEASLAGRLRVQRSTINHCTRAEASHRAARRMTTIWIFLLTGRVMPEQRRCVNPRKRSFLIFRG